jgi:hypothetical protein
MGRACNMTSRLHGVSVEDCTNAVASVASVNAVVTDGPGAAALSVIAPWFAQPPRRHRVRTTAEDGAHILTDRAGELVCRPGRASRVINGILKLSPQG